MYKHFTASPIEDYQKEYFKKYLEELATCDTTEKSLKKYHELENINQKFIFEDHPHSINKFIISPKEQSYKNLRWEVDLNSFSEDSELENEFNKVPNFTRFYSKIYDETKMLPIFREIYKRMKALKQQDQNKKIPPISLSKVSQQLIDKNYINKDYKKYLFASDEANETAGSSNPPLEGGSKLLAISGRGQKTHHNFSPNVVENTSNPSQNLQANFTLPHGEGYNSSKNTSKPAPHRQFIGSATLPENKILGEGYNSSKNTSNPAPYRQQVGSATLPENKILGEDWKNLLSSHDLLCHPA